MSTTPLCNQDPTILSNWIQSKAALCTFHEVYFSLIDRASGNRNQLQWSELRH